MRRKEPISSSLPRELAEHRFVALYEENAADLLAYARRRAPVAEDAADLGCRNLPRRMASAQRIPRWAEARLWLHGVARLTLWNQRRAVT